MIYKMLPRQEGEPQIYARIDDDGLCRLTCTAEYPEFKKAVMDGVELQDADGVTMSPDAAKQFVATLP